MKFKSIASTRALAVCQRHTQCQPHRRVCWEEVRFTDAPAIGRVMLPVGDPVGRSIGRMDNLPMDHPLAKPGYPDGMSMTSRRDYHAIGMSKTPVERPDLPMGGHHFT